MSTGHDDPGAGVPAEGVRPIQAAEPGEHLCSFHTGEDDRRRLAAALVAAAMGAGERVIYVTEDGARHGVASFLEDGGVPVRELLASGQLTVMGFGAFCGSAPAMDPETVLAVYRREADRSREAGFSSTRVAVDMHGVPEALGSLTRLAHWEGVIGRTFRDAGITAVCQYDGRGLSAADRARLAAEHAGVATDDGTTPLATFTAASTGDALRVAGELDLSTAPTLARALRARAVRSRRVDVDLGDVTFIDVAAVRTFFEAVRDLPADGVLVLRGPPARMRRLLDLVRWRDARIEVRDR